MRMVAQYSRLKAIAYVKVCINHSIADVSACKLKHDWSHFVQRPLFNLLHSCVSHLNIQNE